MDFLDHCIGLAQIDVHDLLALEQDPGVADFENAVRKILGVYGLRNAVYYCPTLPGRPVSEPFIALTYEKDWVAHYMRQNYLSVDPVVTTGVRSLLPVDWSGLDRSNRKALRMFNESQDAGIGSSGLTIPIRGPENGLWALFSVTSSEPKAEWAKRRREIVADLVMIGNFLHQKVYDAHARDETIDLNAITRRETEALTWTAEGKTVVDIAKLMNISAETVKAHLDSARFKLRALNRVHAVAKAIRNGIIR